MQPTRITTVFLVPSHEPHDESIKHPSEKGIRVKFGAEKISLALLRHPKFIFREAT